MLRKNRYRRKFSAPQARKKKGLLGAFLRGKRSKQGTKITEMDGRIFETIKSHIQNVETQKLKLISNT